MIANPTTLILGAGASAPQYPVGGRLRQLIVSGAGAEQYEQWLATNSHRGETGIEKHKYERLRERFEKSHIVSIDAFLAEPENQKLADVGHIAIAAALLPCETATAHPDWYPDLFNAIRFRDEKRKQKLKVVTFNYDVSLEFFLFHAFQNSYSLSAEDARKMFNETVEIIHVYGDLGELEELSDSPAAREYAPESIALGDIAQASKRIKIIGRHEDAETFVRARQAITGASFVGILGYGFDEMNNGNLRLKDELAGKHPFSTCYGMGSGARARLTSLAHKSKMVMGGKTETVKAFLDETDFLRGINETNVTAEDVTKRIEKVFALGMLPYVR